MIELLVIPLFLGIWYCGARFLKWLEPKASRRRPLSWSTVGLGLPRQPPTKMQVTQALSELKKQEQLLNEILDILRRRRQ